MRSTIIILLFVLICTQVSQQAATCKDGNGNAVDWWIILKTSANCDGCSEQFKGLHYAYTDSNGQEIKIQKNDLHFEADSPLIKTLQDYQELKSEKYASLFWNDQPLNQQVSSGFGHSKGILIFDDNQGFIISHSFPVYPLSNSTHIDIKIPQNAINNAQHVFCLSTSIHYLKNYALALMVDRPYIYNISHIPEHIHIQIPELIPVMKKEISDRQFEIAPIFSTNGHQFLKIAKSGKLIVDFYQKLIAEFYEVDLKVQSWTNGSGGRQLSNCTVPSMNVLGNQYIKIGNIGWKTTVDHSKLVVSLNNNKIPLVCIGDVNRMESQKKRGGGALCMQNQVLWKQLDAIMTQQEPCPLKFSGTNNIQRQHSETQMIEEENSISE